MKHIKIVAEPQMNIVTETSGCGECRSSCQSACKTSCTVGNQVCEQKIAVRKKGAKK
ncbi:MAG: six-cysteine ranthipeptide SCIFF [Clostridia bacterium]